jgi:membrane protein YqaA with SNARE-associated domain
VIQNVLNAIFLFFIRLGGFGLFALAALDSSFLFLPLGNDLLMIAFTIRKPHLFLYYAAVTTGGSVLGSYLTDIPSRKLGETGLADRVPKRRLDFIRRRFDKHAALTLIGASLMPPPFPYTLVVIVAAGLQYSRKRMLAFLSIGRLIRFVGLGLLAIVFGRHILRFFKLPAVKWAVGGLVAISLIGSAISVCELIRKSRKAKPAEERVHTWRRGFIREGSDKP